MGWRAGGGGAGRGRARKEIKERGEIGGRGGEGAGTETSTREDSLDSFPYVKHGEAKIRPRSSPGPALRSE